MSFVWRVQEGSGEERGIGVRVETGGGNGSETGSVTDEGRT